MKQSSKAWEETKEQHIILLQLVRANIYRSVVLLAVAHIPLACSGAAATISSDALMTPFDGIFWFPMTSDKLLNR